MKITKLSVSNFLKVQAVEVTPDGAVVTIAGANAQGKTSVLRSIAAAFGGKKLAPDEPVRKGAARADIVAETEELIVHREFTPDGETRLTVRGKDGAAFASPQALLDKLVGSISFDPTSFLRMPPKDQAATLRKLVGLEFSKEDAKRQGAFERRTEVNREAKRIQGAIDKLGKLPDDPGKETSAGEILAELQKHAELDGLRAKAQTLVDGIGRQERELAAAKEALAKLNEQGAAMASGLRKRQDLQASLATVEETNRAFRLHRDHDAFAAELDAAIEESEKLTAYIAEIDAIKTDATTKAKYPIAGLAVSDTGVTFKALPLEQASQAEKIRVAMAIGAALNPELRVLLIQDASLLDSNSMALVAEFAEKNDMQCWLETCSDNAPATVVIENGMVAAKQVA